MAILATKGDREAIPGALMKIMSAKEAKNWFGRLIDTARAEPVTVEKHGRIGNTTRPSPGRQEAEAG